MKKEIELKPYVHTWLKERTGFRMDNPLDKTFQDFTFADNVVACQFGNYKATSKDGSVDIDHSQAPHLFIGDLTDAKKLGQKLLTENGKHYVIMDNYKFEIINGAKFASEKQAKQQNLKGEKVSNTRDVDFTSEEVRMSTSETEYGLSRGRFDTIGTRGNMPATIDLEGVDKFKLKQTGID